MEAKPCGEGIVVQARVPELDVYSAPAFRALVQDAVAGGVRPLVVDLTGVCYMDSAGLAVLCGAQQCLSPGERVVVRGAEGLVRRVLGITCLDRVFVVE